MHQTYSHLNVSLLEAPLNVVGVGGIESEAAVCPDKHLAAIVRELLRIKLLVVVWMHGSWGED